MRKLADSDQRLQSRETYWATRVNEVKQERDELKQKLADAENVQRTIERDLDKSTNNLDKAEQDLKSLKEANEALAAQIKDATAEMQVLRAANTRLQQIEKLGFWGRLVWSLKGKV